MADEIRIVSVNGMLGYGYEIDSLKAGIAVKPHLMGCDAGSTDPGPYYLGSGNSLVRPDQIYRDLKPACSTKHINVTTVVVKAGHPSRAIPINARKFRTRFSK